MKKAVGIIPARYASVRFPGKPLVMIKGKSMIRRVYEQASKSTTLRLVAVATDDERIFDHVHAFGGRCLMTSPGHRSGTERCNEAARCLLGQEKTGFEVVVNIQGDEPYIDPGQIDLVTALFRHPGVKIGTLVRKIDNTDELLDPNVVKVVLSRKREALLFSRQPLPYVRGKEMAGWLAVHAFYKHIGLYAYDLETLEVITNLPPSSLEIAESLEQLRWIENGFPVQVAITEQDSRSVDTPGDLLKLPNSP
jgi:3-deoxy-manno-octulosonate cytidylyltransferase (CMP-KDO synthetase)